MHGLPHVHERLAWNIYLALGDPPAPEPEGALMEDACKERIEEGAGSARPQYVVTQITEDAPAVRVEIVNAGPTEVREVPVRVTGWYVTDRNTGRDYGPHDTLETALRVVARFARIDYAAAK